MFLTKKSVEKIWAIGIAYALLGGVCFLLYFFFASLGVTVAFFLWIGVALWVLCPLAVTSTYYAEGKWKWITLGNKLVRNELRPMEFIRYYEALLNAKDLVLKKPCMEVLQLLFVAYDILDEKEKTLATIEETLAVAKDKKRNYITLLKVSFLFDCGEYEAAETLFNEVRRQKLDFLSNALADTVMKSDRAKALGDYKTAENFHLQLLGRSFPKLDNLGKVVAHFNLGEIYEKMGCAENAVFHYRYCAENGGETAVRTSAANKLQALRSE